MAALGISLVALVASIGAVIYTRMAGLAQRELTRIERDRRADEVRQKSEAQLIARFENTGEDRQFVIENIGMARAEHLTVTVSAADDEKRVEPRIIGEFPPSLGAGGRFTLPAVASWQGARRCDVTFSWSDGTGPRTEIVEVSVS